ncbi:MAG: hypothetical protein HOC70_16495 [Gammaproteobacteria bacterium]|nr:hypothetical protein [Gammaproteobacteria bacterium]MBT7369359.1 hypothetical protein [Gammaproteobacteria bacterium]
MSRGGGKFPEFHPVLVIISATDISGKNLANPAALRLVSAMILDDLGLNVESERLRTAYCHVVGDEKILTPDPGGLQQPWIIQRR